MSRNHSSHQPPQTRLILVRHAETEANQNQLWQGDLDAPLTPRGRQQVVATAARVAELHAGHPIDVCYVSPLARAQSTASAIAEATGLHFVVDAGLREFGLGDWEGRSLRELRELENLWGRWEADPAFAPPNGESPVSFNWRATQTLASLAGRHAGQTLLVVTHGAYISSVLATWLGGDARNWRSYDPPNCAISIVVRDGVIRDGVIRDGVVHGLDGDAHEVGGWRGVLVNDISHLPLAARVDYQSEY